MTQQGDGTSHRISSGNFRMQAYRPPAPAFLASNPEAPISFNLSNQVVDLVREG